MKRIYNKLLCHLKRILSFHEVTLLSAPLQILNLKIENRNNFSLHKKNNNGGKKNDEYFMDKPCNLIMYNLNSKQMNHCLPKV